MKTFLKAFPVLLLICTTILLSTSHAYAKEFTDGPHIRDELTNQIRNMLQNSEFERLEEIVEVFRATKARFPDGQWKLHTFFSAFEQGTNTPEWVFPKVISLAEQWHRSYPNSVTAQCVLAGVWKDYAWKARGGGYASEVEENAWFFVRERLDKAWGIINTPPKPGVADSPRRHYLRLVIAKARGTEETEFERLFKEALKQEPDYYPHYVVKADYLMPKWHGNKGDWQRFITEVADRNPRGEGATIYTRTAWSMFPEWRDFQGSGISWDKMKAGFEEIEHNYPESTWILNNFARFACRAGDIETLKPLLARIDSSHYYPDAWDKDKIEDCRMWAELGKSRDQIAREKLIENMSRLEEMVQKERELRQKDSDSTINHNKN